MIVKLRQALYISFIIGLLLAVSSIAVLKKSGDLEDFYHRDIVFCITCDYRTPPGTIGKLQGGYPVPYYTAYNVLPDEFHVSKVAVSAFILDWLLYILATLALIFVLPGAGFKKLK